MSLSENQTFKKQLKLTKKSDLKHINDSSNLFYIGNEYCFK